MATMTNKQQLLNQVLNLIKKQYEAKIVEQEPRSIIEQLLYGICREGTTQAKANKVFDSLRKYFFDWNEVRVSTVHEVEEAMKGGPGSGDRAQRIISILQEWFEQTYSFEMEDLAKKGVKDAAKKLSRLKGTTDFAIAWVIQHGFGGHAIPLDAPMLRVLRRLGIVDAEEEDVETIRASLEHHIPKAKGPLFTEAISLLADEVCTETHPRCSSCSLKEECPTGQENIRSAAPEPKPRKSR